MDASTPPETTAPDNFYRVPQSDDYCTCNGEPRCPFCGKKMRGWPWYPYWPTPTYPPWTGPYYNTVQV